MMHDSDARLGIRITTLYYIITTRSLQVNQKKYPPVLWYHKVNRERTGSIYPLSKSTGGLLCATANGEVDVGSGRDGLLGEVVDR